MNDVWVVKAGEDEYEVIAHLFAGTYDYRELEHKPQINDIELNGNKTLQDLNIASINQLESESSRAQNAEAGLLQGLAAETQRATAKETELEEEIGQQGKVDDVEVDDISVVEGKVAKIYTRIKGFGIGVKLVLELSHFLSYSANKISITNPYAHTDEVNHKILI